MNILYKTTFNRSPGDDITLRGVKNILKEFLPEHNSFVYDAGKDMAPLVRKLSKRKRRLQTDIWHPRREVKIDLVIIAGTPVWTGSEIADLENYIVKNNAKVLYLGVGSKSGATKHTRAVLKNCIGFIARDEIALSEARKYGYNGEKICCPSIFCLNRKYKVNGDKIGIVVQADTNLKPQIDFIHTFSKSKIRLITHHIEDYVFLQNNFEDWDICYSRFVDDLLKFYLKCKNIYSMRIHGSHLAFALEIPTVCLKHTVLKSITCKSVGIKIVDPNIVKESDLISVPEIIEIKRRRREEYTSHLRKIFKYLT